MDETPGNLGRKLIVNYGGGVDSTAILVELARLGVRPDAIVFADVGNEAPWTYEYLDYFDRWLESVGFPTVTRVKRYDHITRRGTTYTTLEQNCLDNETLPSIAFGFQRHGCSIKWKADTIEAYLTRAWPERDEAWAGEPPLQVIGYDNSTADRKRRARADKHETTIGGRPAERWYPLQDWGWDREECKRRIAAAGLRVPEKSACWFCPASQKWEIARLGAEHPDLLERAFKMERSWLTGKHADKRTTCKGLGFTFAWHEWCEEQGLVNPGGTVNQANARALADELRGQPELTQLTLFGAAA